MQDQISRKTVSPIKMVVQSGCHQWLASIIHGARQMILRRQIALIHLPTQVQLQHMCSLPPILQLVVSVLVL